MSINIDKLENAVIRNGKLEARCPACKANGADSTGNHLFVENEGRGPRWGCVTNSGPAGAEHRRLIASLVGLNDCAPKRSFQSAQVRRSANSVASAKPSPRLPLLRRPNDDLLLAIMELRNWPCQRGLELLADRGLLWDADVYDDGAEWPAWVITDSARINAQARTYDGAPWNGIGRKKAKGLPGTTANWPIGAPDIGQRPNVIICEGQPDFCAALFVAWFERPKLVEQVAPVCMTGAGNIINPGALHYFAGKRVRIMTHNDPGGQGQDAARRWATQLDGACAKHVDQVCFGELGLTLRDGSPIKDLADYASLLGLPAQPGLELLGDLLDEQ